MKKFNDVYGNDLLINESQINYVIANKNNSCDVIFNSGKTVTVTGGLDSFSELNPYKINVNEVKNESN